MVFIQSLFEKNRNFYDVTLVQVSNKFAWNSQQLQKQRNLLDEDGLETRSARPPSYDYHVTDHKMATGFKLSIKFKQKRVQEQHKCFKDDDSSGDGSELFPSSKKAKVLTLTLEDRTTKSKRLQDQGTILAEHERYAREDS